MLDNSSAALAGLSVVATPIGNLEDIGARALAALAAADVVLAEDTRRSRTLLQHFGIDTPLRSLHEHNEAARISFVLEELAAGRRLALISDAGTPLISDPGYTLVRAVQDAGYPVTPVPGASAVTAALSVAGLATDRFCFEGFLPARAGARCRRLEALAGEPRTLVFYETPQRIAACIDDMVAVLGGDREAAVARELTKLHEQIRRDTLAGLQAAIEAGSVPVRGEFVVVVAGRQAAPGETGMADAETDAWLRALAPLIAPAELARIAARVTGARRASIYRRLLELAPPG